MNEEYQVGYSEGYQAGWSAAMDATPPAANPATEESSAVQPAPVQEPVATVTSESGNPDVAMSWWHEPPLPVGTKLYTTPPAQEIVCSTGLCHYKPAAPDLQAELDATNKQVEILSDALAESRREVAALKAVQEPVAWGVFEDGNIHDDFYTQGEAEHMAYLKGPHAEVRPLYTTPPAAQRPWVGLTDEELRQVWYDDAPVEGGTYIDKLRQVEIKLKEKNNG